MKVLLCASEGTPFIKTGGLADVIGALPLALKEQGVDVRVVLPYYKKIKQKNTATYKGYLYVRIGDSNEYAGVFEEEYQGIKYYFIDSDFYFNRDNLYGYGDDCFRFAFFNFAILEMLKVLDFYPDIMHVNDWQTGLIPYILHQNYQEDERYQKIKTLFSIHNIQYQGQFGRGIIDYLSIPYGLSLEYHFGINFMKSAIIDSDLINTVSKTYKEEVLTDQYGYGLQEVLKYRYDDFYGILNGLDVKRYDPKTDKYIFKNYSLRNYLSGKQENKNQLLDMFGLNDGNNSCVFSLVSRLADQKGIDLFFPIMEDLINECDAKFIFMGSGDQNLEDFFRYLESKYPNRFKSYIGYSDEVAQKIYAGSDVFLMPSKFEPCGLGQMIAMRYGTLPLVRETGGLKDTVIPYNKYTKEGNGFSFKNYDAYELKNTILMANDLFKNNYDDFKIMVKKAISEDFSWDKSSKEYIKLYKLLMER